MTKQKKLPNCKRVKDGLTGAEHIFCAAIKNDMGTHEIVDYSRMGNRHLDSSKEVMDLAKELHLKRKDTLSLLKMSRKTFRPLKKISNSKGIGGSYSGFSGWFKNKNSSDV
ncbi:hypothetical protein HY449_03670 [Candidatus Pacearchaeota archaeon]|nr:hypothetical protein [Candidatus Pacearchaeota archaeon]